MFIVSKICTKFIPYTFQTTNKVYYYWWEINVYYSSAITLYCVFRYKNRGESFVRSFCCCCWNLIGLCAAFSKRFILSVIRRKWNDYMKGWEWTNGQELKLKANIVVINCSITTAITVKWVWEIILVNGIWHVEGYD